MHLTEIQALAEKAWNKVRGDDPVWNECSHQHRETKTEEARGIAEHGASGNSPFEKAVSKLIDEPPAPTSYGGAALAAAATVEAAAVPVERPEDAPKPKKTRKAASKHAAKVASKKSAKKSAKKKEPSALDKIKQSVVDTFSKQDKPPTRSMARPRGK